MTTLLSQAIVQLQDQQLARFGGTVAAAAIGRQLPGEVLVIVPGDEVIDKSGVARITRIERIDVVSIEAE